MDERDIKAAAFDTIKEELGEVFSKDTDVAEFCLFTDGVCNLAQRLINNLVSKNVVICEE